MNKRKLNTALAAVFAVATIALPLSAAVTIKVTDNAGTVTCAGTTFVTCTTSDANFIITINTAISNSPGGPATLTKTVNAQSLTGAPLSDLIIEASDTGFVLPSGLATLTETVNTNTPVGSTSATGTVTGTGFLSNSNTLFGTESAATGPAFVNTFAVGGAATASTGANFTTPFALTEILNIHPTSTGFASFTATLAATQVPEPASVALFGGILLVTVGAIRRRTRSNRA
jgi:hypothetical protein